MISATEFPPEAGLERIPPPLLAWFDRAKRVLPWRTDRTAYRVWVSEIMLQQTRVETVRGYYLRFMEAFPSLEALALASEERLLKQWEGLGYYSRARNLQAAAQIILSRHGGMFPSDPVDIRALPGIGEYTAGAISSIAFGLPEPAVDGNVLRVLARFAGFRGDVMKPAFRKSLVRALREVYPRARCGDFTESLMELGATVCLPHGVPLCADCPLSFGCCGFRDGTTSEIPLKPKALPRRIEDRVVLLIRDAGRVLLHRRPSGGLLASLWELPNFEFSGPGFPSAREIETRYPFLRVRGAEPTVRAKHVFSHIEWNLSGLECTAESRGSDLLPDDFVWVTPSAIRTDFALPSAFRAFRNRLDVIGPEPEPCV